MIWYAELLLAIYVLILFCGCAYFRDLSSVQYQVDAEAVRLAGCLMQVQERSRNYHYLQNSDFHPFCEIYKDKYIVHNEQGENSEIHYLQNDVPRQIFTHSSKLRCTAVCRTKRLRCIKEASPNI